MRRQASVAAAQRAAPPLGGWSCCGHRGAVQLALVVAPEKHP